VCVCVCVCVCVAISKNDMVYIAISKNDMVAAYCIHTHEHKHALHVYAFEI
jgi:hypothetical protein